MKAALLAVLFLAAAAFSVSVKNELRTGRSPIDSLALGERMPDFALKDLSGAEVTLAGTLKTHKLVAINFWASWCGPCRLEMPSFEKVYESRRKDGFVILGVNEDLAPSERDAYLSRTAVTFPILVDPNNALMTRLQVRALPTTILVGADGRIAQVSEGVEEYLDALVSGSLPAPAEHK